MSLERESLSELQNQRTTLESKLSSAQNVFEHIATPGFSQNRLLRLDTFLSADTDLDQYIDNVDRVTGIQVRLRDISIPKFQSEVSAVCERIESLTSVQIERLNAFRARYQRIQERVETDLPVAWELLAPITTEIQRLEELMRVVKPVPAEPTRVGSEQPQVPDPGVTTPAEEIHIPEEVLPVVVIDKAKRIVQIGERTIQVRGDIGWSVLEYLCERATRRVNFKELEEQAKQAGSVAAFPSGSTIMTLRRVLEIDPGQPQIILSERHGQDTDYIFNAEVRFVEEPSAALVEKVPTEDKQAQALADIAEIQNGVDSGVLKDIEAISKAQEHARAVRGSIEFQKPKEATPVEQEMPVQEAAARTEEQEAANLARLDAERKTARAVREEIVREAKRRNRENRELVLDMILGGMEVTPQEVKDLFGRRSDGLRFSWSTAKSSMIAHLKTADGRIKLGIASTKERKLRDQVYGFMGESNDQDFSLVIGKFDQRLTAWFKGETTLKGERIVKIDDQDKIQPYQVEIPKVATQTVVEPLVEQIVEPPSKKPTERRGENSNNQK